MNSKAIRKQLLAAVAMVLVAAVALGSSTYAWFVASGTVKAEGMKVQAQAEGNLVIRHTTKNWGTVATADPYKSNGDVVAGSLKPASTANLTKWVHASADGPATYVSTSDYDVITSNVTPGADDGGTCNGYVLVKQFFIRSATAQNAPKGLYIDKINVTVGEAAAATTQNLSSSLRVGIKCTYGENTKTLIYAPVGVGDNAPAYGSIKISESNTINGVYVPADGATGRVAQSAMTPTAVTLAAAGWDTNSSAPYNELLGTGVTLPGAKTGEQANTSTSADAVEVFVYVWFEGEDTHLYSDNFAAETMDVSIEFQSISSKTAS